MTEGGTLGRGSGITGITGGVCLMITSSSSGITGGGSPAGSSIGIGTIGGEGVEAVFIATGGGAADIEPDDDGAMDRLGPEGSASEP